MDKEKIQELEDSIRNASPLELASKLQEAELYDKKETREVVDEVYKEFENQGSLIDEVVVPVFMSIADGFLESTAATRKLRKKGLTASRIISQCQSFSYDQEEFDTIIPDGYTEWKNVGDQTREDFKKYGKDTRQAYSRGVYEDKDRLNAYKDNIFANNGGKINATDEYTKEKNVYQYRSNPDARRSIEKYKHDHQAEVDHIVPLKQIHEQLKGNYALTDADIKNIANQDSNFALTSARINRGAGAPGQGGKFDMTNSEFVEDQRKREQEGRPNLGISEEAKENMLKMEKEAQKSIDKDANKAILNNITGRGTGNTGEIWKTSAKNAANQSKDYVVGNVILFIIKPLYYEISDIFVNGLKEGVNADSTIKAFRIRFGRVKDYVLKNALSFLGDNVWEFVKGLVSSLIEGIISLFIGIFKQVLKVIKEGIKIFVQAGKVLFGKHSNEMTATQKGDAIIKILGGSIIVICGIGIEALLNKIGIPEPWSIVLSTTLSGIASTLFMLLLDKIDLFSVKAEKRRMRIEEIFDERIKDIQEAEKTFNTAAIETMREQNLQFTAIKKSIWDGIETDNISSINTGLSRLASFMHVDLGYNNQAEFIEKFDSGELEIAL
ncbi:MAG: DNA repair protein [Bacilli bacterium]|nr:DNA repair protein [Bacilli bacterium]